MKMNKTIIAAASAALALSVTAYAEKPEKKARDGKGPSPEQREAMKKKMLERFDADKDGKLSDEEKKTARETIGKERKEIHAAVLAKFDADKDGKLSEEERKGVREWVKENYPNAIHMRPSGERGKDGGKRGGKKKKDAADA
ncbi:hypothetical protein NT6N_38310 [Oceaniferula spumae]|uniref:EF-hand domain-containing protein n=1 Tax=Oceaniferula spumae TaxID=2979115 RepID=A0AAT9FSC8_9BACT